MSDQTRKFWLDWAEHLFHNKDEELMWRCILRAVSGYERLSTYK